MTDQEKILSLKKDNDRLNKECRDWRSSINLDIIVLLLEENKGLYDEIAQLERQLRKCLKNKKISTDNKTYKTPTFCIKDYTLPHEKI